MFKKNIIIIFLFYLLGLVLYIGLKIGYSTLYNNIISYFERMYGLFKSFSFLFLLIASSLLLIELFLRRRFVKRGIIKIRDFIFSFFIIYFYLAVILFSIAWTSENSHPSEGLRIVGIIGIIISALPIACIIYLIFRLLVDKLLVRKFGRSFTLVDFFYLRGGKIIKILLILLAASLLLFTIDQLTNGKYLKLTTHSIAKSVDPASYEAYQYGSYKRDENNVYYKNKIIPGADPGSFVPINYSLLGKDKYHVYKYTESLDYIDAQTFEVIYVSGGNRIEYAKDKNYIYINSNWSGYFEPLLNIDYDTFGVSEDGKPFDKNGTYTWQELEQPNRYNHRNIK